MSANPDIGGLGHTNMSLSIRDYKRFQPSTFSAADTVQSATECSRHGGLTIDASVIRLHMRGGDLAVLGLQRVALAAVVAED